MSAHAAPTTQTTRQPNTSELIYWNNAKLPVLDCAIFIPSVDLVLGRGATADLTAALKAKGYSAFVTFSLHVERLGQADSGGHEVSEYYTDRDFKKLNRNGNNSLYLSLTGIRSSMLGKEKKHKFTLRLHTIGRAKEVAYTIQSGMPGQANINVTDLPRCQPL